jgi:hypothetical protein
VAPFGRRRELGTADFDRLLVVLPSHARDRGTTHLGSTVRGPALAMPVLWMVSVDLLPCITYLLGHDVGRMALDDALDRGIVVSGD